MKQPGDAADFILITGASSGLGRAMAVQLSQGHRLILGGRDIGRLRQTLDACSSPDQHLLWPFDLTDIDNIANDLSVLLSTNKVSVRAYIHSAALLNVLPLRSLTPAMISDGFRTNVLSVIEIVRTLTRKTVNQQRLKSVVFISSIVSKFGAKGFTAYAATKGALDSLMKSLAVELAPAVRVNSVLPGAIKTEMTSSMFDDRALVESFNQTYPLGIGLPQDVVDAAEFLISDKARWITGQQLVVDGGRTSNISA